MPKGRYSFGPSLEDDHFEISTFAPDKESVELSIDGTAMPMRMISNGFWKVSVDRDMAGKRYGFLLDGKGPFPDPGGRFMPEGIDGLSQLVDPGNYEWKETAWKGLPLEDYLIEEIHVGAFTAAGTYSAMESRLGHLSDLGVTAVEIMPVAQFYGTRNWGYDGVYLYSPHYSYGHPSELKHLVDTIHSHEMAAILDVVYNHSGPVGNHLDEFGPFHNLSYNTPWGNCFNFDGEYSDHIREYILQNAIYWLREFRFDALRLDAVHGIVDHSPVHILEEMTQRVGELEKETGRQVNLMAESDRNDRRLTGEVKNCGLGIDAQWNDDFHHVIHTALTGEHEGYYMDYGNGNDICSVMRNGFLYQGQYSRYLKRKRGTHWDNPSKRLVVCSQNHDQIGNRAKGERLITLAGMEKAKLAALLTILSPFTPLLFMGEEMGEESPFLFFIQTYNAELSSAIYRGRLKEFGQFDWTSGTQDPSKPETFEESKIKWSLLGNNKSREFMALYRKLITMRKRFVLKNRDLVTCSMRSRKILELRYGSELMILASLNPETVELPVQSEEWEIAVDTSREMFAGINRSGGISGGKYELKPFAGAAFISREAVFP